MTPTEIDALIAEIPESLRGDSGSVCGPSLEYDNDHLELIESAKPIELNPATEEPYTPEELNRRSVVRGARAKIDWREVKDNAFALLNKSNDLQIAEILCRAWLNVDGFAGLRAGLKVFSGLTDRYWSEVHPQDPRLKQNTIASLGDANTLNQGLVYHVGRTKIVELPQLKQSFSLKDVEYASGDKKPPDSLKIEIVDRELIDEAFRSTPPDQLIAMQEDVQGCLTEAGRIAAIAQEHGASADVLKPLTKQFDDIERLLSEHIPAERDTESGDRALNGQHNGSADHEGVGDMTVANGVDSRASAAPASVGSINSRADVVRSIDAICRWYENNEPSSPVPLMLARAKKTVSMNYMDIVKELSPSGLNEARVITGVTENSSESSPAENES